MAQAVVKLHLEPIVEPEFHEDSYGYRPGKSAVEAVGVARKRCWRQDWVIDLDIKGFFDNLDHDLVMKAVRFHTDEKWIASIRGKVAESTASTERWTAYQERQGHTTRGCDQSVVSQHIHASRI